ncbi:hypothetical protein [Hyphomicrobium sp. CS1GBMeth3]|uniref:hypothetical protein n=1 Tax=Hyphomicrobium sp. CS1GBMeth3 TaxID=1892845 RepID=UPI0009FAFEAB|nr:hypothetical protein [Hyphomicrobium sp. CS1GBMeth3]
MRTLTLAALAAGAVLCFGAASASAAPPAATPMGKTLSQSVLTEPVQYRRYCRRWSRECRVRWGWGWRYRRCMRRHGC